MPQQLPGIIGLASSTNELYCRVMQNEAYTLRPEDNLEFLLHSINFRQAVRELRSNNLDPFKQRIVDSATRLVRGGADFLVISSNTSHIAADEMASVLSVPLLDIRETAAAAVQAAGNKRVGIIGTSQTILAGLYDETFSRHALDVLAPTAHTMEAVDRVIFDELVHGVTDGEAAGVVGCAVDELCDRGAEVVLLACTDLTHIAQTLLGQPVLDSTTIHARAAARMALREC
ncbi:aspartate/glutamate racemase family protein [Nocardia farcinica]|uniref:aspartate/glutamate racemase family protein n=1 Tax=Nocardia farcinica TaxID=37329 RepID=UPI0022BA0851|nr:amino acid racemase [Nocardia farcinica]MCZ9330371.1 amino acid racemase [Nocardia farcinica]